MSDQEKGESIAYTAILVESGFQILLMLKCKEKDASATAIFAKEPKRRVKDSKIYLSGISKKISTKGI